MPIPPSEVGSALDLTAAKQWMEQIDDQLRKADPDQSAPYTFPLPHNVHGAAAKWVCKQYQAVGWSATWHSEQREGDWISLSRFQTER